MQKLLSHRRVCVCLLTIHMGTAWEHSHPDTIRFLYRFLSFSRFFSPLKVVQLGWGGGAVTVCCRCSHTLLTSSSGSSAHSGVGGGWNSPHAGQTEGCFLRGKHRFCQGFFSSPPFCLTGDIILCALCVYVCVSEREISTVQIKQPTFRANVNHQNIAHCANL